ncbi:MAG: VOC family protein [Candidatus Hermodarchaeota archaeon]
MRSSLHHAHLFASNLEESIKFYREMFGAKIVFDLEVAGARNVMLSIGTSKINFYDQPAKDQSRGAIHHLGIETDDLEMLVTHMKNKGFQFINEIKNIGTLKYVMVAAPDNILLELFELAKNLPEDQYNLISTLNSL